MLLGRPARRDVLARALQAAHERRDRHRAHASCEATGAKGDDDVAAQDLIVRELIAEADATLPPELRPPPFEVISENSRFRDFLRHWSELSPRKLVLLLDEIDSMIGQSLIAILRQLRSGFADRPGRAPWSLMR